MSKKIKIAVIFGGKSPEHDVSLESGKNIAEALDPNKYHPFLLGIDRNGIMRQVPSLEILKTTDVTQPIDLANLPNRVFLVPGPNGKPNLINLETSELISEIDVAFPIIHGPYGEDGTIQGYLKLLGLPFVGPGILGSAMGMDKDVAKKMLVQAGLPVAQFVTLRKNKRSQVSYSELKDKLGLPFFIKPANMGSSVGVHKVSSEEQFEASLDDAFKYDTKVLVEEYIQGREIECAVLGNDSPITGLPGEVIPQHEYYSYDAKYLDANGALLQIPAELTAPQQDLVRQLAVQVFQVLECQGLSRVDFFLTPDEKLLINEINTLPGFTKISMYPKMMGTVDIAYRDLIDRLIGFAFGAHESTRGPS